MENILQLLLPLIVVILTFVLGNRRRKTEQQRTPEAERQTDVPQDNEVALPPFMENFPFERDNFPDFLALEEAEPEPEPENPLSRNLCSRLRRNRRQRRRNLGHRCGLARGPSR